MLEIRDLSGGYGKDRDTVCGISLTVGVGELVSVVGRNGSGKSTLLRLALRYIKRSGGEVFLDGASSSNMSSREIARLCAYLPQTTRECDMTVLEYVLHGRFPYTPLTSPYSERDRRIALESLLKMSLDSLSHRRMSELSGGERQKVYIARILCQQTQNIILDEPTASLDISHQIELMQALRGIADEGRSVLCVMHDIPLALEYSDKIAVIEDGRLAAFDTPQYICESGILRSALGIGVNYDGKRYCYEFNRAAEQKR